MKMAQKNRRNMCKQYDCVYIKDFDILKKY